MNSFNTLNGDLTVAAGTNVTITPSGSTLTIATSFGALGGAVTGTSGVFVSPALDGTGVTGVANNGVDGWGVYGASSTGMITMADSGPGMASFSFVDAPGHLLIATYDFSGTSSDKSFTFVIFKM